MEAPNYNVYDLWLYTESRKAVPETAEMRSGAAFFYACRAAGIFLSVYVP